MGSFHISHFVFGEHKYFLQSPLLRNTVEEKVADSPPQEKTRDVLHGDAL